jgi:hypothetical protein
MAKLVGDSVERRFKTGVKAVIWHTSPACARYLEYLECHGDTSPDVLAAQCHTQVKYAYGLTMQLKSAGVIRVVAWRHNVRGNPTPIYRLGPGKNKSMPEPATSAQRLRNRYSSMVRLYGSTVANKVLNKNRSKTQVVIDGRRVRSCDHDAHLAGRVSR